MQSLLSTDAPLASESTAFPSETTGTAPIRRRRAVNQQPPAVVTDFTGYAMRKPVADVGIPMQADRPVALQVSLLVCLTWDDLAETQCRAVPAWSSPRLSFDLPAKANGVPFLREKMQRGFTLTYSDQFSGKTLRREHVWMFAQSIDIAPRPVYLLAFENPVDFK